MELVATAVPTLVAISVSCGTVTELAGIGDCYRRLERDLLASRGIGIIANTQRRRTRRERKERDPGVGVGLRGDLDGSRYGAVRAEQAIARSGCPVGCIEF